jgi:iron(III) transport system permease protein
VTNALVASADAPRSMRPRLSAWTVGAVAAAVFAAAPFVSIAIVAAGGDGETWRHLAATVLPRAAGRTLVLMAGVAALTLLIGVATAWLVTSCDFPGRRWFAWLLVLPLAMPTYIVAFAYLELFDYAGWLQTALRGAFGFESAADYWFPRVRSMEGAIALLSFVLYPYVYLTARASFLQQSAAAIEVGRTLGCGPWACFFRVALPLARPALAAGVALALMETINDIGAVELLGVPTLTVTIYQTWLQRGSLSGAAQIALALLLIVFALIWAERAARGGRAFHALSGGHRILGPIRLRGVSAWLASAACALPILFGFVFPAVVLVDGAMSQSAASVAPAMGAAALNSASLAAAAAALTVGLGVALAYALRLSPGRLTSTAWRISALGYAIPGTVLAVGLLAPLASVDRALNALGGLFGADSGLWLSGTVAALLIAYACRFLPVASSAIDAGFRKVSPNLDAAARTLGRSASGALVSVHLPILRPALAAGALLVFVDAMKELPATLLLRPFNFETLATEVYLYASLEQFAQASLPALGIVISGLAPVLLLHAALDAPGREKWSIFAPRRFSAVLP